MANPAQDQTFGTPSDQSTEVFGGGVNQDQPQGQVENPYAQPGVQPAPEIRPPSESPVFQPEPELQAPLAQPTSAQPTQPTQPTQETQPPGLNPPVQQYQNQYDPYLDPYYDDLAYGPQQELLVYEWVAPSRPFKKHNRQYYTTVGTIILLIALILFFAGQILPVAVVLAVGFMIYVMTSIPPTNIKNQLTTYGIRTGENLYYWDEMGRFWFKKKYNDEILHVEVARFPERLTILVGEGERELIRELLATVLLEEEPLPTYYERAAAWLQQKIPLDIES